MYYDKFASNEFLAFLSRISYKSSRILFQRRAKAMIIEPIFRNRQTKVVRNKVFVLMPFTEEWSNRIWKKILQPLISDSGMEAKRADDLYGRDIMEDIWTALCEAQIVVADITGRNANVFYELGIAHTLGKSVILLSQRSQDIPFDLNRYRHIIYQDNLDGYELLRRDLPLAIRAILDEANLLLQ